MTEQLLQQLIDFINSASPVVWNAFVRQVYANSIVSILFGLLSLAIAIGVSLLAKRYYKIKIFKEKNGWDAENETIAAYLSMTLSAIMVIATLGLIANAIKGFLNPDYYAIINIIYRITGN